MTFRIDWLDLPAVRGTLESLLQRHRFRSIDALALSLPRGPGLPSLCDHGEKIALTVRTLVGKVTSLLFNMLISRVAQW